MIESEASYARLVGITEPKASDVSPEAVTSRRTQVIALLSTASDGSRLVEKGWPVRYALRRFAWHVLDHAWEIQDKSHD